MPITPFLAGHAFDPEAIEAMSVAFRSACHKLGLNDRDDPLNGLVAKRIIALAQTGMRDPSTLCLLAVQEFKAAPQ
jgi:hypothetical protein